MLRFIYINTEIYNNENVKLLINDFAFILLLKLKSDIISSIIDFILGLDFMKKIDATVKKETLYIFAFSFILSVLMQAIYLVLSKWDYTVLLGNLIGLFASTGNFLLMGITVQNALGKEQKDAKNLMKLSQMLRMLMLFIVAVVAYLVPCFNLVATVISFVFPRIAVMLRSILIKKQ